MLITCPSCGCQASAELWQNDENAREVMAIHASLPPEVQAEALRYLSLFRPVKYRLSWSRAKRLLAELRALVVSGDVTHDRKPRRICPPSIWAAAMAQMVDRRDKITRPLLNHNYLLAIAYDLSGQGEYLTNNPVHVDQTTVVQTSKTMGAVAKLQDFARGRG